MTSNGVNRDLSQRDVVSLTLEDSLNWTSWCGFMSGLP